MELRQEAEPAEANSRCGHATKVLTACDNRERGRNDRVNGGKERSKRRKQKNGGVVVVL